MMAKQIVTNATNCIHQEVISRDFKLYMIWSHLSTDTMQRSCCLWSQCRTAVRTLL